MLHPEIAKTVKEIFKFFDDRDWLVYGHKHNEHENLAESDPEACVLSLLNSIKNDLPSVSSMLRMTVDGGTYKKPVKEAREILNKTGTKKSPKKQKVK